jgi:hypothetical protein
VGCGEGGLILLEELTGVEVEKLHDALTVRDSTMR